MWPQFGIGKGGVAQWQVFHAHQSVTTTNSWISWAKPFGCSEIRILMIAAGGGGGKGAGGAATVASGGGGSGGISRMSIPAWCLPDTLYLRPGNGGAGSTTSANATAGTFSYVSTMPDTASAFLLMSQAGGSGGNGAASQTAGAAGAAGVTTGCFTGLGDFTTIAGQAGTAGSATANGAVTAITAYAAGIPLTGGGGGGNGTAAGGNITAAGWLRLTLSGGVGTTGGAGNVGRGYNQVIEFLRSSVEPPILFCGGSGGGGHVAGAAGAGGNGSFGCGGGGGGNSSAGGGTAGNGGNGGDGLIFIGAS